MTLQLGPQRNKYVYYGETAQLLIRVQLHINTDQNKADTTFRTTME